MSYPVCLGDATSSGGQVVSCQLTGTHTLNGKPPAVLGDKATCPLHSGEFAFIEGHPTRKLNGIPVVLHGHRLACGCQGVASHAMNVRVV
ncbi:PAAR domain-containing protein [Pseudomonas coronafaciens pv. porri]|uniref:PAAR domain-containing protein n=1 Tax=Pseudomonas syringae group TaxID=136849 RepID=UPI0005A4BFBE|nr:PAAR domain-containing protein [Pseudomonas coronafaciens]KGS13105.1 PAAR repeat containing protein [Pseudomonas coronafaciens]KOP50803.1 PAAR repeat-containing protein [Pseudomonas coronafaciens pv. porri]KPY17835.1 PAAR domain-containing protein [Pseudomonas coronafaciens pv. porri]RMU83033.1 PAAR domain-containing protein [Pseudomonas coronafaciens pv. porri]RMW00699.1 PAAR domain-containing protein [Pseudomonas coronafaciens pv. porri]